MAVFASATTRGPAVRRTGRALLGTGALLAVDRGHEEGGRAAIVPSAAARRESERVVIIGGRLSSDVV